MARRFVKVSEEEIEEAFFYASDLVNTKTRQLSPSGSMKSGGYIPRRFPSRIYPPLFTSPSGDSCILSRQLGG